MKKHRFDLLILLFFIGTIFSCGIITILSPQRTESTLENREMATNIKYTQFHQYLSGALMDSIENIANDQFILKDFCSEVYADYQRSLDFTTINDRIIIGDSLIVQQYANSPNLDAYTNIITKLKKKLDTENIPFTYISTPIKADVLLDTKNYKGITISNRLEMTDKYLAMLNKNGVTTIDLYPALQALNSTETSPYFKTDHHWNNEGAYVGYSELISKYSKLISLSNTDTSRDNFSKKTLTNTFYGSDLRTIGGTLLDPSFSDELTVYIPKSKLTFIRKSSKTAEEKTYKGNGEILIRPKAEYSTSFNNADKYKDYYGTIMGGNNYKAILKNETLKDGPTLVLAGDSFSLMLLPMLINNFKEIHYFDARSLNFDLAAYAKEVNADMVSCMFNANMVSNRYAKLKKY